MSWLWIAGLSMEQAAQALAAYAGSHGMPELAEALRQRYRLSLSWGRGPG